MGTPSHLDTRVHLTFARARRSASLVGLLSPPPGVELQLLRGRLTPCSGRVEVRLVGPADSIDTTLALYRERRARVERC